MTELKIISGCQTGADVGGLRAAELVGIKTGGWMPKGFRTDEGPRPDLAERFGLVETTSQGYSQRTLLNVKYSDVTVIFGDPTSRGCSLTRRYCCNHDKLVYCDARRSFVETYTVSEVEQAGLNLWDFLENMQYRPAVINIAGNRERINPGIEQWTTKVLRVGLSYYKEEL